jgi:hypothetical protein
MRPVTKYSRIMPSTTYFHNPPIVINPDLGPNQSPSLLEDINRYSVAQSRDVYHGLPPIDFPWKESQSGYASEDIRNSEVTSNSLVPYQVLWSAWLRRFGMTSNRCYEILGIPGIMEPPPYDTLFVHPICGSIIHQFYLKVVLWCKWYEILLNCYFWK